MKKRLGIYLHIPFCIKKCLYCDFCSFPDLDGDLMRRYSRELCRRIKEYSVKCEEYTVDTVYFGGGTPTLLPIECFAQIFDCLRESFDISAECEISCECNPASADENYLKKLRTLGVNRLSIGLQSADDGELANRLMHPKHHIEKVYRVKVAGTVSEEQFDKLLSPMTLDGYKLLPIKAEITSVDETGTVLKMTLKEGRNRQVRRMCQEVGLTVKRLCRVAIGSIKLNNLPVGKWRYLEPSEVEYLYKATQAK